MTEAQRTTRWPTPAGSTRWNGRKTEGERGVVGGGERKEEGKGDERLNKSSCSPPVAHGQAPVVPCSRSCVHPCCKASTPQAEEREGQDSENGCGEGEGLDVKATCYL